MPKEGVPSVSHDAILTYDEIVRLTKIFAQLGIKKIKLTGGEPLVRKNLPSLVKDLKSIDGIDEVTLTTNGYLLSEQIEGLKDAGIDSVNVSLDTLDGETFKEIVGVDGIDEVLKGIDKCVKLGIKTKINCVTLKESELMGKVRIAELARDRKLSVRFIEMMPIGLGKKYDGYLTDEIMGALEGEFGKAESVKKNLGNGPSEYYHFEGFEGNIGFISAISHKFCGDCNRVRLTSEGQLKPCLYYDGGADLRELLRSGKDDEEIKGIIEKVIYEKPVGHEFSSGKVEEKKLMSKIGG